MSSQELRNLTEREAVSSSSTPFLHHPYSPLNVRDVFICCGQILILVYYWNLTSTQVTKFSLVRYPLHV